MPNYSGVLDELGLGLKKVLSNPSAEESAGPILNEFGQPYSATPTTSEAAMPVINKAETSQIAHNQEVPPETPYVSHDQELTAPQNPKPVPPVETSPEPISPHAEVGTHDYSEPSVQDVPRDYVHANAEGDVGTTPNFTLGKTDSTYTGRVKPGQELVPVDLPSPLKPETAEDIKTVLSSKNPEERSKWLTMFKDNPKKALAILAGGGLVANNLMSGDGNDKKPAAVVPTKSIDKSSEEEPEEAGDDDEAVPGKGSKGVKTSDGKPSTTELPSNMAALLNRPTTYQDQLQQAFKNRDNAVLAAQLSKAGSQIGASIARVKPQDTSVADTAIGMAQNIPKDLEAQWDTLSKDPNSQYSKDMRDTIKRATGYDIPASASAQNLKDSGMFKELVSLKETQEKTELRKQNQQLVNVQKQQLAQEKQDKETRNNVFKTGTALESVKGNKALQNDLDTIRKAQNSLALIKRYPNPNDIPPGLVTDTNIQLANIMAGGQAPEGLIKEITAHPFMSRLSRFIENVGNTPTGAQMGDFVKQNAGILTDFENQAQNRMNNKFRKQLNTIGRNLPDVERERFRNEYIPGDVADEKGNYGGATKIFNPKTGETKYIPFDQVNAAKKAGGQVVSE